MVPVTVLPGYAKEKFTKGLLGPGKEEKIMLCALSKLDKEKIENIKSAEKKMGKTLLAFSCHDVAAETLTEEELDVIRKTERELGIVLVAVKA
ncbi:MAG: hypothetical protein ACM3MB_09950 [Acidobacteriota bacterium]